MTGSDNLVGGVSNYSSGFAYRSWGGLKTITDGSSHTSSLLYNSRLQPTHFDISGSVVSQNYEYFSDGRLSFVHNTTDNNFDRSFTYDHAGRLKSVAAGGQARQDSGPVPMFETFDYNAWNNTIGRVTETWTNGFYDSGSYTNGRRTEWGYDADGRIASIDTRAYTYDAAGQTRSLTGQRWTPSGYVPTSTSSDFDGDGLKVRETSDVSGSTITYYLRSSVLRGEIVEELSSSGQKQFGYVYTPAGGLIARQLPQQDYVMLKQASPTGASQYEFFKSNTVTGSNLRREFDPMGANVRLNPGPVGRNGAAGDMPSGGGGTMDSRFGAIDNPAAGCIQLLDGVPTPCDWINRMARGGGLQLRVGTTRYDIELFGDSHIWVDAWESYDTGAPITFDPGGNPIVPSLGLRNVGYFVTIPGAGSQLATSLALRPAPQNSRLTFLRDPSGGSYGSGKEDLISSIVNRMLTDACTQAFQKAGLTPPSELLKKGVVIGPASLLLDSSKENLAYIGITEFARNRDAGKANRSITQGVTIRDHPGYIADTVDGRPRIFLHFPAFDDLSYVIRHEFIHAGGANPRPVLFGGDLDYLGYDYVQRWGGGGKWPYKEKIKTGITEQEILAACR